VERYVLELLGGLWRKLSGDLVPFQELRLGLQPLVLELVADVLVQIELLVTERLLEDAEALGDAPLGLEHVSLFDQVVLVEEDSLVLGDEAPDALQGILVCDKLVKVYHVEPVPPIGLANPAKHEVIALGCVALGLLLPPLRLRVQCRLVLLRVEVGSVDYRLLEEHEGRLEAHGVLAGPLDDSGVYGEAIDL